MTVHETLQHNAPMDVAGVYREISHIPSDILRRVWRAVPCGSSGEIEAYEGHAPPENQPEQQTEKQGFAAIFDRYYKPVGVRDSIMINAGDPYGVGIWIGAFSSKPIRISSPVRTAYNRIAAHVAAGYRLHRRVAAVGESPPPTVEAVLTPAGRVVHAEDDAKKSGAALAEATRAIELARGRLRRSNPEAAVAAWRGLASCKWSLVDKFESDGKRFIVAKANSARVQHVADLTDREMQVLAHAALGHHAKLIAYELGIAASTVRVLMMRAARKLNTRTSRATVQRFIELRSAPSLT